MEGGGRGIPIRCAAACKSPVVTLGEFFLEEMAEVVLSILPLEEARNWNSVCLCLVTPAKFLSLGLMDGKQMLQATLKGDNNSLMALQGELKEGGTGPPDSDVSAKVVSGANAKLNCGGYEVI